MPPTLLKQGFIKSEPGAIPINYIIKKILELKNSKNKIFILKASTGSGKSTVLPVSLNEINTKTILSLQPRVFNALNIPSQITKYYGNFKIGENLGYQTGSYQNLIKSGILFMTYGTFSEKLRSTTDDDLCKNYSFIIMDEAHEMELEMSRIYHFVREFLNRCGSRDDCPIFIITSATFEYKKFASYFNTENYIKVKGFSYPIEEHYLEYDSQDYVKDTAELVEKIYDVEENENSDMIIFVDGANSALNIRNYLALLLNKKNYDIYIFCINGESIEKNDISYQNIFKPASVLNVKFKIIISTNVGETGVTFPNIKYIIDTKNNVEYYIQEVKGVDGDSWLAIVENNAANNEISKTSAKDLIRSLEIASKEEVKEEVSVPINNIEEVATTTA